MRANRPRSASEVQDAAFSTLSHSPAVTERHPHGRLFLCIAQLLPGCLVLIAGTRVGLTGRLRIPGAGGPRRPAALQCPHPPNVALRPRLSGEHSARCHGHVPQCPAMPGAGVEPARPTGGHLILSRAGNPDAPRVAEMNPHRWPLSLSRTRLVAARFGASCGPNVAPREG